jgi:hypothetical protein
MFINDSRLTCVIHVRVYSAVSVSGRMELVPKRASRTLSDEHAGDTLLGVLCERIPFPVLARYLHPKEIGRLAQTCQTLRRAITHNNWWSRVSPYHNAAHFTTLAQYNPSSVDVATIPSTVFWSHPPLTASYRATLAQVIVPWLCQHRRIDALVRLFTRVGLVARDVYPYHVNLLRRACLGGHRDVVEYITVLLGLSVSDLQSHAPTMLYTACGSGSYDLVRYLVETYGLTELRPPNQWNISGFALAAQGNHTKVFLYLIETFNPPMREIRAGNNAILRYACEHGNLDIVKCLVSTYNIPKASFGEYPDAALNRALSHGHTNILRYLDEMYDLSSMGNGRLVEMVWFAAKSGSVDTVDYLCTRFRLTAEDCRRTDNVALMNAAMRGHPEIARYFFPDPQLAPQALPEYNS